MIVMKMLENDFHRAKHGPDSIPHMVEVPASPDFVPAIISNTRGKFIVSRKLTSDGRIRVGIFDYESEKVDTLLPDLVDAAAELSREQKWKNVFTGDRSAGAAFNYIRSQSGMGGQPHLCLVPNEWDTDFILGWLGRKKWTAPMKFKKHCRVVPCGVRLPVFCSRPDFVGMLTYFMGGTFGFLLHNVKRGMAFCDVGD